MNKFYILIIFILYGFTLSAKESELDSIFRVLDYTIENSHKYVEKREQKISDYKQMFDIPNLTAEQRYEINLKLYNIYYSFKPDSAISYIKQNIFIAEELKNDTWLIESKLRLSDSYTMKNMFIDALDLIKSVPANELNNDLLRHYYSSYIHLLSHYPQENSRNKDKQISLYRDSLRMLTEKKSFSYKNQEATRLQSGGRCKEARDILLELYKDIEKDTHGEAMIAFPIGNTYRCENNYEMQKKYYAIAAIADIRNGVKENAALRALAIACYETNDIERAYRYIYKSMEDAMFANVNFRIVEISHIFPIIERSYQEEVQK